MQVENYNMKNKYTEKKLFLILLWFLFGGFGYSQVKIYPDTVVVMSLPGKGVLFQHTVKSGNTVFSLSKKYKTDIDEIYLLNTGLNKKPLNKGMNIFIPYNKDIVKRNIQKKNSKLPGVFYKVGAKETLFRIAKVNLGIEVKDVIRLNNIKNNDINEGQLLFIGYLEPDIAEKELAADALPKSKIKTIESIEREAPVFKKIVSVNESFHASGSKKLKVKPESADEKKSIAKNEKTVSKNNKSKSVIKADEPEAENRSINESVFAKTKNEQPEKEKTKFVGIISRPVSLDEKDDGQEEDKEHILRYHRDSGVALWNKSSRVKGVYVLSKDAAVNSMIEISNPMVQRKIFARVIGNIPANTYPDNVKVVLSPEAAMTLGALDSRFFVKLHYLK